MRTRSKAKLDAPASSSAAPGLPLWHQKLILELIESNGGIEFFKKKGEYKLYSLFSKDTDTFGKKNSDTRKKIVNKVYKWKKKNPSDYLDVLGAFKVTPFQLRPREAEPILSSSDSESESESIEASHVPESTQPRPPTPKPLPSPSPPLIRFKPSPKLSPKMSELALIPNMKVIRYDEKKPTCHDCITAIFPTIQIAGEDGKTHYAGFDIWQEVDIRVIYASIENMYTATLYDENSIVFKFPAWHYSLKHREVLRSCILASPRITDKERILNTLDNALNKEHRRTCSPEEKKFKQIVVDFGVPLSVENIPHDGLMLKAQTVVEQDENLENQKAWIIWTVARTDVDPTTIGAVEEKEEINSLRAQFGACFSPSGQQDQAPLGSPSASERSFRSPIKPSPFSPKFRSQTLGPFGSQPVPAPSPSFSGHGNLKSPSPSRFGSGSFSSTSKSLDALKYERDLKAELAKQERARKQLEADRVKFEAERKRQAAAAAEEKRLAEEKQELLSQMHDSYMEEMKNLQNDTAQKIAEATPEDKARIAQEQAMNEISIKETHNQQYEEHWQELKRQSIDRLFTALGGVQLTDKNQEQQWQILANADANNKLENADQKQLLNLLDGCLQVGFFNTEELAQYRKLISSTAIVNGQLNRDTTGFPQFKGSRKRTPQSSPPRQTYLETLRDSPRRVGRALRDSPRKLRELFGSIGGNSSARNVTFQQGEEDELMLDG